MKKGIATYKSEETLPFPSNLIIWLLELNLESKPLSLFIVSLLSLLSLTKQLSLVLADCLRDFQKPHHNAGGMQPLRATAA